MSRIGDPMFSDWRYRLSEVPIPGWSRLWRRLWERKWFG